MCNRIVSLDLGRWFFAFLIISLHMPMWAGFWFYPVARCGVPFFYMLTGFFLAESDGEKFLKSVKKWFRLWLAYTFIFLFVGTVSDFILDELKSWTIRDTIQLFLSGNNSFIDEHNLKGRVYGISSLWFLYAGGWSLIFFSRTYSLFNKKWFKVLMLVMLFSGLILNYICRIHYNDGFRLVCMSIPFMYLGMYVGKEKRKFRSFDIQKILIGIVLVVFLSFGELFLVDRAHIPVQNYYITTIPLSLLLFMFFLNLKINHLGKFVQMFPQKSTMDVFIWHRMCLYFLALVSIYPQKNSAIVVFILVAMISFFVRKVFKRM